MAGEAVAYRGVGINMDYWFWVIPVKDPAMTIPIVHGPFLSKEAAIRDSKKFCPLEPRVIPRTQILVDQGWIQKPSGRWMPPTSYKTFDEDKAIKIVSHPDYRMILDFMA